MTNYQATTAYPIRPEVVYRTDGPRLDRGRYYPGQQGLKEDQSFNTTPRKWNKAPKITTVITGTPYPHAA